MKVIVDRLNGTLSITLGDGHDAVRLAVVGQDAVAKLDRYGQLARLDLFRPLSPEVRRTLLPRLAAQFHVPALAHLDPRALMGRS